MSDTTTVTVSGYTIQIDRSNGQGHCWRDATADETPENIVHEIAAEILDGNRNECDDYVASNGQHYRW